MTLNISFLFLVMTILVVFGCFFIVFTFQFYNLELDKYLKLNYPKLWSNISPFSNFWSLNYLDFLKRIFRDIKFTFNKDYLDDEKVYFLKNMIRLYLKLSLIYIISVVILCLVSFLLLYFFL